MTSMIYYKTQENKVASIYIKLLLSLYTNRYCAKFSIRQRYQCLKLVCQQMLYQNS